MLGMTIGNIVFNYQTCLFLTLMATISSAIVLLLLKMKINKPKIKGAWEKLLKTISIFSKLKTRKVIRFTLIKGINDNPSYVKKYVKLFEKSNADFLEVKSYMYLGESRNNLKIDNMPSFTDVASYAHLLEKESKVFKIIDDVPQSRIVLLKNKKSKYNKYIK
jgi:tRNA wybutosine-synthesizing protein 1